MNTDGATNAERDGWRLGLFFAAYFALAGLLAPYLPLYFESVGLSAVDIGLLTAMGQGMRVVGPTLWGWVADHTQRRIALLRWTSIAMAISFSLLLVPTTFAMVFFAMLLLNLFMTAQMPVGEALVSARIRGREDAATRYGRLRVCGSAAFVVVVLALGPAFDRFGMQISVPVGLLLCFVLIAAVHQVREGGASDSVHERVSVSARMREPRVRWFLISAALMVFAHGALYTYLSLYLAQLGYSKSAIGVFWVLSVVVEMGFFLTQGRWFARFGLWPLLTASFLIAAVRFLLIAELAMFWWMLAFAQVLHAFTFAVHHSASILTIQRWFPGRAAARGQALYISTAYGVGGTSGSLVAAWLWSVAGPSWAFVSSSIASLIGAWAIRRARRHDPDAMGSHQVLLATDRSVEL
ncbi:MAG: MFS transporter [Burkholderiaceae bacterium]